MNATASARLAEVTAETLMKLAFMFAAPAEETPAAEGAARPAAQVDFGGIYSGAMEISVSAPALAELAVNMLGSEEQALPEAEQGDALKEFVNVVCGNLLPVLFGPQAEFAIYAPRLAPGDDRRGQEPFAVCQLALDQGFCQVRVWLEGSAEPCLHGQG